MHDHAPSPSLAPAVLKAGAAQRRQLLRLAAASVMSLPLAAAAGFNFFLSEYTATLDELQAEIGKRFPVQQRYAELFSVVLRDPQLSLDERANRATVSAQIEISSPLLSPPTAYGVASISSALRYDAPARALRLQDPRAERLELRGLTGRDAERLQQIGAVVAKELLRDQPLRTFTEKELTVGRKVYAIGDITVQQDGIKVQLL